MKYDCEDDKYDVYRYEGSYEDMSPDELNEEYDKCCCDDGQCDELPCLTQF